MHHKLYILMCVRYAFVWTASVEAVHILLGLKYIMPWHKTNLDFKIFKCIVINWTWNIFTRHQLSNEKCVYITLISFNFKNQSHEDVIMIYLLYCIHHNVLNWFFHLHDILYVFWKMFSLYGVRRGFHLVFTRKQTGCAI